ncbi:MAG: GNAT family N-acetyltransferase [Clostridia bacterium]|nr:GNAT family N-acetyltransferase [Clostridia bacterium]
MIFPRAAEYRDFEAIMDIVHSAQARIALLGIDQWQDGYPEPELIQSDIETGIGCVFEEDGKIAAYLVLLDTSEPVYDELDGEWISNGTPYATLHRMAIGEKWCGRGLSTQIIAHAESFARERGCASLRADTHRGNVRMRRLLEKCGFTYCGECKYDVTAGDPIRVAYEKMV